jgi:hypothetical protein
MTESTNDYSEITCDLNKRVTILINTLERKAYAEALHMTLKLMGDLMKLNIWLSRKIT